MRGIPFDSYKSQTQPTNSLLGMVPTAPSVASPNGPQAQRTMLRSNIGSYRSEIALGMTATNPVTGATSLDSRDGPFDGKFGVASAREPARQPTVLPTQNQSSKNQSKKTASATGLSKAAQHVADLLESMEHDKPVVMLPSTGKTAAEAAVALNCNVAEIANCIVFRRSADDVPVVVVASGVDRIDEQKVAAVVGPINKVDAKYVKKSTGYSIGGVSPIGLKSPSVTLIDQNILKEKSIWAAAGHPHAVFNLTPDQLLVMTNAPVNKFTV